VLGYVCAYVSVREWGCRSGSSLKIANNDGVSKLMRIFIEKTQLEVGIFEPFLFTRHSIHGHSPLTASCVLEVWSLIAGSHHHKDKMTKLSCPLQSSTPAAKVNSAKTIDARYSYV
jgi:hypothetical protein